MSRLIGALAVLEVLAGCAIQNGRCDCCQAGTTETYSKSFAELSGIDTASRKNAGAHQ